VRHAYSHRFLTLDDIQMAAPELIAQPALRFSWRWR
jgi:hypothetical protein